MTPAWRPTATLLAVVALGVAPALAAAPGPADSAPAGRNPAPGARDPTPSGRAAGPSGEGARPPTSGFDPSGSHPLPNESAERREPPASGCSCRVGEDGGQCRTDMPLPVLVLVLAALARRATRPLL